MSTVALDNPLVHVSEAAFYDLCHTNPDLRLERTTQGQLIVMVPTGGETGDRNDEISCQLRIWNKRTGLGKCFNSSTGFRLPNGANRSPDASWVRLDRWEALTSEQRQGFPPLAPDFVVDLRSPSDQLGTGRFWTGRFQTCPDWPDLQEKMQEYRQNGVRLGWLINPECASGSWQVEIYRAKQEKEVLESPTRLSGEDVLPGFLLGLSEIAEL